MNCEAIKAHLKPFLDDLLMEEERAEFCKHISSCQKCGEYVRSIGSFSNQLWKLGKVNVPHDLMSTIIYRLAHHPRGAEPPVLTISRRQLTAGIVLVILASVLIFGIKYISSLRHAGAINKNVSVKMEISDKVDAGKQSFRYEEEAALEQLTPEESALVETNAQSSVVKESLSKVAEPRPAGQSSAAVAAAEAQAIHWHFKYIDSGRRAKLTGALSALDIRLDYQDKDVLILNISGEKSEQLLEKFMAIYSDRLYFADFTTDVSTSASKNYPVSIYLEDGEADVLHWHIDPLLPEKKSGLIEAIREFGSSVDYQSGRTLVFTISDQELPNLKRRIQSMRILFAQYGFMGSKDKVLSSGPVKVSVYFMK